MAKKKKKTLQDLTLEELEKKRKGNKSLVYVLIGLSISFLIILGFELISGNASREDLPLGIIVLSVIGVVPSTWKEYKEAEKELENRNSASTP